MLGVFVKSDIKSIVWYSPVEFEVAGYEVPTTWQEFVGLVDQIKADGFMLRDDALESGLLSPDELPTAELQATYGIPG